MEEDRYTFRTVMEKGGYSGPIPAEILAGLPAREGASPWYLLPHQHRPVTHLQKHALGVEAVPVTGGWRLRVFSDEREDVFTQITLVLGQEGTVEGDGVEEFAANRYFLKKGSVIYAAGPDRFEISGGVFDHRLGELRNDAWPPGCKYLHFNLLTPFDHTIELRLL
ncbi:hypothetical protein N6H14_22045 [Paenibacillus sp. CC-CFT747]|nr:hypothetical protein N6H14_22045 [Paenibacillus sp. CC-CFT747]